MKKYQAIYFDMGNTLIDFHQGLDDISKERLGFIKMAEFLSSKMKEQNIHDQISAQQIEDEFWRPWDDYTSQRRKEQLTEFPIEIFLDPFLNQYNIRLTDEEKILAMDYQNIGIRQSLVTEDNLSQTLTRLKQDFELGVISNSCNYDEVNIAHFKSLGIKDFFDSFTFSYSIKASKPRREIFEHALAALHVDAHKSIMVGDSLEADIKGAQQIGMYTIWYNPKRKINKTLIVPDKEIQSLDQLQMISEKF